MIKREAVEWVMFHCSSQILGEENKTFEIRNTLNQIKTYLPWLYPDAVKTVSER